MAEAAKALIERAYVKALERDVFSRVN